MTLPRQADVLGTPISLVDYDGVLQLLAETVAGASGRTYAFCNVHSVMTARRDVAVAAALRETDVTAPDGMPLVWYLRRSGYAIADRVYGPDLMERALRFGVDLGWRHYFHGAEADTLRALETVVRQGIPGLAVAGRCAPPFRPLSDADVEAAAQRIRESGASHVWLALGMPKQELLMARMRALLPGTHLLAVGAAFDFLSGTVPQAPDWMQRRGLEWAFRLRQEPRRLWRRYAVNNPAFMVLASRSWLAKRLRSR